MSHHCSEAGSVPSSIVPSSIGKVGPLMAADEMHQLNNETIRGIGIGEKVSAPVCVINEQRCFTHKAEQLRTTCVGKKWPQHSVVSLK